jgi:hypothetical protein
VQVYRLPRAWPGAEVLQNTLAIWHLPTCDDLSKIKGTWIERVV